jgi:glutamate-ammonia-ligase adenylyltransferase
VQRVVHALTARTAAGVLYEIDMRLRPSGRAGPVVTSMEGFHSYQVNKAWTWEHQAIVRARMIIGPESLRRRFEDTRREVLRQPRDPAGLKHDINSMRAKMSAAHDKSDQHQFDLKHGAGGIVDIEFIVQYLVLRWAPKHPELLVPRDNIGLIEAMRRAGVMGDDEGGPLAEAYYRYLTAEHIAKLAEAQPRAGATEFEQHRRHVEMLWRRLFE